MCKRNIGGVGERMKKQVLGVKIDDISMSEATAIVEGWLKNPGKHYIVTTNPEFILTAREDPTFKKILNNADLSIPDGKGLKFASDIECTIPGVDFMEELAKMAAEKAVAVGFLGGGVRVANLCAERLQKKYPKLQIVFAEQEQIKDKKCDLLFVAFGHPKQEFWIYENLSKIPVKVAMGVGGAFDYISGKVPRAPKWMRNIGLEWLFRLIVQPWRIKRQIKLLKYVTLILCQHFWG